MGVKVLFVYWNQNWKLTNQCMQYIFFCLVASISYKNFWNKLLFFSGQIHSLLKNNEMYKHNLQVTKWKNNHRLWNTEMPRSKPPTSPTLQTPLLPTPPRFSWHPHKWALYWLLHFKLCCSSHPFRAPTSRFCSFSPSTRPLFSVLGLVVQTLNWIVLRTG